MIKVERTEHLASLRERVLIHYTFWNETFPMCRMADKTENML